MDGTFMACPGADTLARVDTPDEQDVEELAADAIRELGDLVPKLGEFAVDVDKAFAVGFGWWMRILRTAEGVTRMHEVGLSQEASPLLRTILHHTAALAWLRQYPDEALEALEHDHARRRQRLGQKAQARDWDLKGIKFGPPPRSKRPHSLVYLDRFEELCDHIEVPNLYVPYLVESTYAHPSGKSADAYLEPGDRGRPRLRDSPSVSGAPLRATVMFAAIATNILGDFVKDERLTTASEAIGERLSLPVTLGPASDESIKRNDQLDSKP
jgi:hypothetical protein